MAAAARPFDLIAWINMGSFGGLEVAFLFPLVLGLFWRRATAKGCVASISVGLMLYAGLLLFKPNLWLDVRQIKCAVLRRSKDQDGADA